MTMRGGKHVRKALLAHGKPVAAISLPLFDRPELESLRKERAELLHKLTHQRLDVRSRIRIEQKVSILTAKMMRLEMKIGERP